MATGGQDGDATVYGWTREYPSGHESPFASMGARQSLGTLNIVGRDLTIETQTPTWAGRFSDYLAAHFPGKVWMHERSWIPWVETIAPAPQGEQPLPVKRRGGSKKSTSSTKKRSTPCKPAPRGRK